MIAIMCDGAWTRRARKALAAELGVSDDVMRRAAAEAARRLRSGMGDPEKQRRRLLGKLGAAYRIAERTADPRAMVAAVAEEAKIRGVNAPQKLALTTVSGEDLAPAYLTPYLGHPAVFAWLASHPGSLPTEGEVAELVKEPVATT